MADYYCPQFSTVIEAPNEDAARDLVRRIEERDEVFAETGDDTHMVGLSRLEVEEGPPTGWTVWVCSEDGGANIEALSYVIADWQIAHGLCLPVIIEWAGTCSKPRTDAFCGGVAVVWKGEFRCMTTNALGNQIVAGMANEWKEDIPAEQGNH